MKANRRRVALCAALVLSFGLALAPSASGQSQFTAESVSKLIADAGPQKAAEQVLNDSARLEAVAAGVAGGRPEWLDVGTQLIGVAESYLRDRLAQSFSIVLQREPSAVLARAASGLPLPAVCGYDPFTAAETAPTRRQFDEAVAQRERAVGAVRRAELAAAKDTCLDAVAGLRAAGARQYQP